MTTSAQLIDAAQPHSLRRHVGIAVQLLLALAVVHLYEIEGSAFFRVMALTTAGYAASVVAPLEYRLPLFGILSLFGIAWVLGPTDGIFLVVLGLALIGIANLPWPLRVRAILLVAVGAGLAVLRSGTVGVPWSSAVWPILGSMFMFRMVLYLRSAPKGRPEGGFWGAIAYFFMLPNLAFPLFPVVDYQTFRRTWFDRDESAIYQQGMDWIVRGLVHLLLYRFVYHNLLLDPVEVVALSDLVQFMLATFLLYLRVSGQFHVIVGLLHLFGFRLPETHKLYYLAHSFTELWRRINIYWTDFMMKSVFYPAYFQVKRLGPATAYVLATTTVFVTTWLLHSYQWFWLRGGFPLTAPDLLFWAVLGALVVRGGLREMKTKKGPRRAPGTWNLAQGLAAARTFAAFCFLWSLWSAESIGQWFWMLGSAANVDAAGIALIAATIAVITALGGRDWSAKKAAPSSWLGFVGAPTIRIPATLVLLAILGLPGVPALQPSERVAEVIRSVQSNKLNAQDAALQHRGYYEQLDVRGRADAAAPGAVGISRAEWQTPAEAGIILERKDRLARELMPSLSIVWNDNRFSTNEFGMRDRAYSFEKPAGTFRIALLGPSHVMGNGVADGETFESLVEERLNRELRTGGRRFEILNFGVDGYTLPQQLGLFEERVVDFAPDLVIITHYVHGVTMVERYLLNIAWGGIEGADPGVMEQLARVGLDDLDRSGLPVPYESLRSLAARLGLDVRMPWAESVGRVRQISYDVNGWAIGRLVEVARSHGVRPIVLALNSVIENPPPQTTNLAEIRAADVPLIDLFDIFPEADRPALRVYPWDDHPNAAGHRLIADHLYTELVPIVTE